MLIRSKEMQTAGLITMMLSDSSGAILKIDCINFNSCKLSLLYKMKKKKKTRIKITR